MTANGYFSHAPLWAAIGAAGALTLLCSGCAITPPVTQAASLCGFDFRPLRVEQPPERLAAPSPEAALGGPDPVVLLLSGGSQHGAFGAGILDQWKKNARDLPRFRVVTGISTGAMQATAAFLNRPDLAVDAYTIGDERELLTPFVTMRNGKITTSSYLSLMRHNAVADLRPLAEALKTRFVTVPVIQAVARESAGRKLLVGVVDVDSGEALALDLTNMARKLDDAVRANRQAEVDRYQDCYVRALIASSSAPLAAPPVFIDNRMYIDGGARNAVFANDIAGLAGLPPRGSSKKLALVDAVYVIVNGSQEAGQQCGKLAAADCGPGGTDDSHHLEGAHRPWDLLSLGLRTTGILVNQIDLYSVADVYDRVQDAVPPADLPTKWHYAYMDAAKKDAFIPDAPIALHRMSCAAWEAQDERERHPVQFYPHYMQCVMAYGRQHANELGWGMSCGQSGGTHSDDIGPLRQDPLAHDALCAAPAAAGP